MSKICSVEGCNVVVRARGYCKRHYNQVAKYGKVTIKEKRICPSTCTVDGCNNKHFARDVCRTHYNQKYKRQIYSNPNKICIHDGCDKTVYCKNLCASHYNESYRAEIIKDKKYKALIKQEKQKKLENELKDIINNIPKVKSLVLQIKDKEKNVD